MLLIQQGPAIPLTVHSLTILLKGMKRKMLFFGPMQQHPSLLKNWVHRRVCRRGYRWINDWQRCKYMDRSYLYGEGASDVFSNRQVNIKPIDMVHTPKDLVSMQIFWSFFYG